MAPAENAPATPASATSWLWSIAAALPAFYLSYRYSQVLEAPLAGENRRWASEAATIKTLEFLLVHAGVFVAYLRFTPSLWSRILAGCVLVGLYGSFLYPLAVSGPAFVVLAVAALLAGRIFSAVRFGGGTVKLLVFAFFAASVYVLLSGAAHNSALTFGFTAEAVAALALPTPTPMTMMARPAEAALFCAVWFFFVGLMEIARALPSPAAPSSRRTWAYAGAAGVAAAALFGGILYGAYERTRNLALAARQPDKPRAGAPVAPREPDKPRAVAPTAPRYAIKPQIDLVYAEWGGEMRPGDYVTFRGKRFGPMDGRPVILYQPGLTVELEILEWSDSAVTARIPLDPKLLPGAYVLQIKGSRSEFDSDRVNTMLGRLFIELRAVEPGIAKQGTDVTLRGVNFGARQGHRAEITTITSDRERLARATLEIVEWTDEAIRARIPADSRFVPGKYAIVVYRIDPYELSNRLEVVLE